jgi:hypothetical protein
MERCSPVWSAHSSMSILYMMLFEKGAEKNVSTLEGGSKRRLEKVAY